MTFISWLVFGVLFMLGEFATGTLYLLAIGLAFTYPATAAYFDASSATQMTALVVGTIAHSLLVSVIRRLKPSASAGETVSDIGQRVEIIEWMDEGFARVSYRGRTWEADKARAEMPDAAHGIIKSIQGGRLIITTE